MKINGGAARCVRVDVENLCVYEARFLEGVIKLLCDPAKERERQGLRRGLLSLRMNYMTGECHPVDSMGQHNNN